MAAFWPLCLPSGPGKTCPLPSLFSSGSFHSWIRRGCSWPLCDIPSLCKAHARPGPNMQPLPSTCCPSPGSHLVKCGEMLARDGPLHTSRLFGVLTDFYRFKVEEEGAMSSTLLAWACIRLDRLHQGFRFIPLRDVKGNRVDGSKLLVKITKTLR